MNKNIYKTFAVGIILISVQFLFTLSYTPPQFISNPSNPEMQFNGGSALQILKVLLLENKPHPTGSEANKIIRDRIIELLSKTNVQTEIQVKHQCSQISEHCADIENIIAIRKGIDSDTALLLMVHYDSVINAPGAGDNMAAVAALIENIQQLANANSVRNDIIFLFTDGEELGMIGATAFAKHHALYNKIALTANFDGRGSSGPSQLFEVGPSSGDVIDHFIKFSSSPSGNSLSAAIADMSPGYTDFTIFKQIGMNGLNFAFSKSTRNYHSSTDTVENLDKNSLQHHGQNQLDFIRAFANQPLSQYKSGQPSADNRVFFDIFSSVYMDWSTKTSWALIAVVAIGLFSLLVLGVRHMQARVSIIALAIFVCLISVVTTFVAGFLLTWPLAVWPKLEGLDHASPSLPRASFMLVIVLISLVTATLVRNRINVKELEFGYWSVVAILLVVMQIVIPGGMYIFLIPLFVFVITRIFNHLVRSRQIKIVSELILLVTCAYFATSLVQMLEVDVSFDQSFILIAPMLLLLPSLTSLSIALSNFERRQTVIFTCIATILVLTFIAFSNPNYEKDSVRLSLVFKSSAQVGFVA